jgi:hypothetical protein
MKLKYIGCVLVGVAIGYYMGQHYDFELKLEQKDRDDA